jgi:signal transduction histidine kinase
MTHQQFHTPAFLLLCLLAIPGIALSLAGGHETPLPVNGVLDLREWNFKRDGNIETIGYWEFFFGEFLSSTAFDTIVVKKYAWVPGVWKRGYVTRGPGEDIKEKRAAPFRMLFPWNSYYWEGISLGPAGYASYRLTVILPAEQKDIGFLLRSEGTAYKLMVNDSLIAVCGKVGTSEITSVPRLNSQRVAWDRPGDTLRIVFQVSNYHYRKGGLWNSFTIGETAVINQFLTNRVYYSIFISGIWFMVSFTLLCFYLYRPKEKVILFLFLWALSALIRILSADERLVLVIIPDFDFEWLIRLDIISGFAMLPFAFSALQKLFPDEFPRWMARTSLYLFLSLFVFVLLSRAATFTYLVVPFQVINMATLAGTMYCLFKAVLHRRPNSVIITIAFLFITFIYVVQILLYNHLKSLQFGYNIMTVGLLFAFAQIILLAKLFSSALARSENFATELENKVEEKTRELLKTQEELIHAARLTETEKIRRRISQDIHDDISSGLNKISWMSELVKIKAAKNKPEELNHALDKIIQASRSTVDNLVEIIWSLNPKNDDLESMLVYMRNYITRFFDETSFQVTINFPEPVPSIEMNPELKRNLFLVMKEALHNAAKYSKARNILIAFEITDGQYTLTLFDDGIGIEAGVIHGSGNGMINMRRRMEEVRGWFILQSEPGKGTRILLEGKLC